MIDYIKAILPYVFTGLLFLWCTSLQSDVTKLKSDNESLELIVTEYVDTIRKNERLLLEWTKTNRQLDTREAALHDTLDTHRNSEWDSCLLPDEYLRVLGEAGIWCGRKDPASGSSHAGSTGTSAEGND